MVSPMCSSLSSPARTRMWSPQLDSCRPHAGPRLGQPDIFAYIEVDDDRGMADTVLVTIHAIPGVRTTETHLVAPV
jgi:hypothetical protein